MRTKLVEWIGGQVNDWSKIRAIVRWRNTMKRLTKQPAFTFLLKFFSKLVFCDVVLFEIFEIESLEVRFWCWVIEIKWKLLRD